MSFVEQVAIIPYGYIHVAGFTTRRLNTRITMIRRSNYSSFGTGMTIFTIAIITVHFGFLMASYTGHTAFSKMHIGIQIFVLAQIFVAHAAAVACGAIARHRRFFLENMP